VRGVSVRRDVLELTGTARTRSYLIATLTKSESRFANEPVPDYKANGISSPNGGGGKNLRQQIPLIRHADRRDGHRHHGNNPVSRHDDLLRDRGCESRIGGRTVPRSSRAIRLPTLIHDRTQFTTSAKTRIDRTRKKLNELWGVRPGSSFVDYQSSSATPRQRARDLLIGPKLASQSLLANNYGHPRRACWTTPTKLTEKTASKFALSREKRLLSLPLSLSARTSERRPVESLGSHRRDLATRRRVLQEFVFLAGCEPAREVLRWRGPAEPSNRNG